MAMLTQRKRIEARFASLREARKPWESEWYEIASLAQPARSRFLNTNSNKGKAGRAHNRRLIDDYGILAFRTLGNGMTSGLSSSSRPWFISKTEDPDLMLRKPVLDWLGTLDKHIYALLWRAGYYDVAKSGYTEAGLFGTEAGFMDGHPTKMAIAHALTAGEYWISLGTDRRPNTLFRRVPMTVDQVVRQFAMTPESDKPDWSKVARTVKSLYDANKTEELVNVAHAVYPNPDMREGRIGNAGKAFLSCWWDEGDGGDKMLAEGGYHEQPFWSPRWDTVGADVYGTGPGSETLPSLRTLQMQAKRKGEATDLVVKPEKVVPASLAGKLKNQPGNNVAASIADIEAIKVPYVPDYRVIPILGEDVSKIEARIDQLTYAELFMAITRMGGGSYKNIEEIASRNQEALTQLGPVIERSATEKLSIVHERAMGVVMRSGVMPDPPEELQGANLKVEFNSILAQLQQMVGIGQIERSVGFVGNLAGAFPEAADRVDVDGMIDEYFDRSSAPSRMRRSVEDANKIRAQRAQQQASERAMAAMPAVRDGADAARLLSEADTGNGQSLLSSLSGLGQ